MNSCLTSIVSAIALVAATACGAQAPAAVPSPDTAAVHGPVSGETLFHVKGCEHCHAANFAGVTDKGPSLLVIGKRLNKEAIANQIRNGGQEMPSFGDTLQPDEVSALVDMLSKKKKAPKGVYAVKP